MLFSTYLIENQNLKTEATLVLHKIIHMVDNAHVDMGENDIRFAVGPMIHKGAYNGLNVVIRKADKISVRLAKPREGKGAVIVIDTKTMPTRDKIDTLLSEKDIFNGFLDAFVGYLEKLHDHNAEHPQHDSEREHANNGSFEDNYNAIIAEFTKTNIEAYKNATKEVNDQVNNNANIIKNETTKLSVLNLQKEYLGTSEAEFISIVKKLPGYKKFDHVAKELTSKLTTRLKSYYLAVVKPLTDQTKDEE